jgi:putative hemolysin
MQVTDHRRASASSTDARQPVGSLRARRLEASWVTQTEELREAQRLRYRVFAGEMGARLCAYPGVPPGHDADRFDEFCAHLIVRAWSAGCVVPQVVGTYRVLTPQAALRAGGFYSETEFDLAPLGPLRARMAELGRACVDPKWRTGGTILTLWSALGKFMIGHGLDVALGCASVGLSDGGGEAVALWHRLSASHLAPAERRVRPLRPLPLTQAPLPVAKASVPPLIKGYLNCGAELLGAPAWDRDFNTAELPMLMRFADLPQRHRRHFIDPVLRAR